MNDVWLAIEESEVRDPGETPEALGDHGQPGLQATH